MSSRIGSRDRLTEQAPPSASEAGVVTGSDAGFARAGHIGPTRSDPPIRLRAPAPSHLDPLLGTAGTRAVILVTAVLAGMYAATQGYSRFVGEIPDLKQAFDMDQEGNVPTWWTVTLLAAVAFVLLLASRVASTTSRPSRRSLVIVAIGVLYVSVDEAAGLHERTHDPADALLDWIGLPWITYAWLAFGLVAAVAVAAAGVRWGRSLPPPVRRPAGVALVLFLAGALGVESVNGWLYDVKQDLDVAEYAYLGGTLVEEVLEMAACIVALTGFARLVVIRRSGPRHAEIGVLVAH